MKLNETDDLRLLDLLYVAADAQTDEEKARVAWRANNYMWRHLVRGCRSFNNLLQDLDLPAANLEDRGAEKLTLEEYHKQLIAKVCSAYEVIGQAEIKAVKKEKARLAELRKAELKAVA